MREPLFLKPVFHEKIWGGNDLKKIFNYNIPSNKTGECWGISGHPHGTTTIVNGKFKNYKLDDLWKKHPEIFGNLNTKKPFPILTKILDAHDDLSVQVHPNDEYAKIHEHELGKTECWYIIQAKPGAKLFYGHNAKNKQELKKWINDSQWNKLLKRKPVKAGDFIYVPSGTVHALGSGIMALETQQSSDSTYRLYDFNRIDKKTGHKRPLHIKQALDTITVPFSEPQLKFKTKIIDKAKLTRLVEAPYFKVYKLALKNGKANLNFSSPFKLMSVISGEGNLIINNKKFGLSKGGHLILPSSIKKWQINGKNLLVIMSVPGKKIH